MLKKLILIIFLLFNFSYANAKESVLILATTTFVENSGPLNYILLSFEKKTGIKVKVIARGTGAAIEMGKRGDADVVFVHSK